MSQPNEVHSRAEAAFGGRASLRERIAAGEARQALRSAGNIARDAAGNAAEFVRKRPLTTLAGVAVLALAIGAVTKPGRKLGRQAGEKGGTLLRLATDAAMAYGAGLVEHARKGRESLGDAADGVGARTREIGRSVHARAENAGKVARDAARRGGHQTKRSIGDLRARLKR